MPQGSSDSNKNQYSQSLKSPFEVIFSNLAFQGSIAGSIAGMIEVISPTGQPLLNKKIRRQNGLPPTWNPKLLYSGVYTNITLQAPNIALQASVTTYIKKNYFSTNDHSAFATLFPPCMGGAFSTLIYTPGELYFGLRQKALDEQKKQQETIKTKQPMPTTFFDIMKKLKNEHGISRIYSGAIGTIYREGIFTGCYLGLIEYLSQFTSYKVAIPTATFIGVTASHPFDTVKTRQQLQAYNVNKRSMTQTFFDIVKSEGPKSLFKGYPARIVRGSAATSIYFFMINQVMEQFDKYNNNPTPPSHSI